MACYCDNSALNLQLSTVPKNMADWIAKSAHRRHVQKSWLAKTAEMSGTTQADKPVNTLQASLKG